MELTVKKIAFVFLLCFCGGLTAYAVSDATRRFGVFVGSNNGGRGRTTLRYAVSDARAVSRVFMEMGGINAADSVLLIEPNVRELDRHINSLKERVDAAKKTHKRTEIVFYYSGHSDEEGLLVNRERYGYRKLRERINLSPSDMRIVILDSCSSGAFTRAKGGAKTQPFLFDDSMSTEGYAFLTSSSATEASQESDAIGGSYFTQSLLTGLRGAADTVGDGRITLNEVYRYAYSETLARTEVSRYGAQHPSYDMQVSGTGDMVLTDIKGTSAGLIIDESIAGRLSIRDSSDYLVAEISKSAGKSMELGLEPGLYRITMQKGNSFFRAEITLEKDRRITIGPADFTVIAAPPSAARGDEEAEEETKPVNVQLVPGVGIGGFDRKVTNHVLIGILGGIGHNLRGFGLGGPFGLNNTGFVNGIQLSGYNTVSRDMNGVELAGLFNWVGEDVHGIRIAGIFNGVKGSAAGVELAGIFNLAGGDMHGVRTAAVFNFAGGSGNGLQLAGIFNWTGESFRGMQMGLFNYDGGDDGAGIRMGLVNVSESENVIPVGLVNVVKNGLMHPAVWYDDLGFVNLSLKSGSKHFYSILGLGVHNDLILGGGSMFITRSGFGAHLPLNRFFLNFDVTAGQIFANWPWDEDYGSAFIAQARFSAGYTIFKHLGIFAGVSYDYILSPRSGSLKPGEDFGFSSFARSDGRNTHKIGFFGGIQF
jgi:hypothetical protein